MLNDCQKYQEIVEKLIKKGIISEHEEEKTNFYLIPSYDIRFDI